MSTDLIRQVDRIDGYYKALKAQEVAIETEIIKLKADVELLSKASAVLKHLLDVMVKDEVTNMAGLVSYGLKSVFDDQNLKFLPVIGKKNDKMHIELKTVDEGIEMGFGEYGGSVAVLESFLLRILCMLKKKQARLMLLDETFASVGEQYIPNTSKLIGELSKKLGLDVLLVTHQKEFEEHANRVYRVTRQDGDLSPTITRVK